MLLVERVEHARAAGRAILWPADTTMGTIVRLRLA
jgi:hypothetical protein